MDLSIRSRYKVALQYSIVGIEEINLGQYYLYINIINNQINYYSIPIIMYVRSYCISIVHFPSTFPF